MSIETIVKEEIDSMMKRYVISTAQRGAKPHKKFLTSLETYCKKNNAELMRYAIKHELV